MRPDSLLRRWRYINHLLTYLLCGDGSLVEEGRMTEAEEMKQRLEQQQRDRLRQFTDGKAVYSPRWFMSVITRFVRHSFSLIFNILR